MRDLLTFVLSVGLGSALGFLAPEIVGKYVINENLILTFNTAASSLSHAISIITFCLLKGYLVRN